MKVKEKLEQTIDSIAAEISHITYHIAVSKSLLQNAIDEGIVYGSDSDFMFDYKGKSFKLVVIK